jgi:subtilisin family serine protease
MNKLTTWLFTAVVALTTTSTLAATDPAADAPPELVQLANNTVICGFKDFVLPEQVPAFVNDLVQNAGVKTRHVYTTAFRGFSAHMSLTAATALVEHNPNIEFCEPNGLGKAGGAPVQAGAKNGVKGKPKPPENTPQVIPPGVQRVGGPRDGTGLTAWIIDSGIALDHPDLNIDASRGADKVKQKGKQVIDDVNGHGTHVAGILAAIDNDIDVVGVAADATVVPVRVLGASNYGSIDDITAGIDYVAQNASPGDVANMSIWAWAHYRSLHEAAEVLADKIPFIVIAGNDGEDVNERPAEPAHVEHPNLYTVSAIDQAGVFTDFSNYGYAGDWTTPCGDEDPDGPYPCATVDFAAPGKDVLSLQPDGSLAEWYGTSMAAPHVAGVILLLQQPNNTPPNSDGTAINDPDSRPDPIVHY